jgi:hypothetical protein
MIQTGRRIGIIGVRSAHAPAGDAAALLLLLLITTTGTCHQKHFLFFATAITLIPI